MVTWKNGYMNISKKIKNEDTEMTLELYFILNGFNVSWKSKGSRRKKLF